MILYFIVCLHEELVPFAADINSLRTKFGEVYFGKVIAEIKIKFIFGVFPTRNKINAEIYEKSVLKVIFFFELTIQIKLALKFFQNVRDSSRIA